MDVTWGEDKLVRTFFLCSQNKMLLTIANITEINKVGALDISTEPNRRSTSGVTNRFIRIN